MARIRYLKPEFFDSEQVASVSFGARLLFQGLWLIADREGRLELSARRIKAKVFPYDDVAVEALFDELFAAVGPDGRALVVPYEVNGRLYLWLPGFVKHQRPHPNEAKSTLPVCPESPTPVTLPWNVTSLNDNPGNVTSRNDGMSPVSWGNGNGDGEWNGEGDRPTPPPPQVSKESHPPRTQGTLVGRGESLRFAEQQDRQHAKHHPEICTWRAPGRTKVCMPAGQVAQLAEKLVGVAPEVAVARVIAWAQAHQPTAAVLPANLFAYWDEQWDARRASQRRSDVPDVDETQRMLRERERLARS